MQACLLVSLSAAVAVTRERALELIAEGRGALPLDCVRRRRARLMRTRGVHGLAEAIQALRREACCPYRRYPRRRPLYVPGVIRAADAELATTVRVRSARPDASTVARVERLLCGEVRVNPKTEILRAGSALPRVALELGALRQAATR